MASEAYYSAAAQVIPVLGLAVVFEARQIRAGLAKQPFATGLRVAFVIAMSLLVLGEVAALNGLYEGKSGERTWFIIVSLWVAAGVLGFSVAWDVMTGMPKGRWWVIGIAAIAVVLLSVLVLE